MWGSKFSVFIFSKFGILVSVALLKFNLFFAVYCIPTAVSVTFSVNMKETLSDFMCSSRRAAALICALVIDNVHHGPLTRLLRLS